MFYNVQEVEKKIFKLFWRKYISLCGGDVFRQHLFPNSFIYISAVFMCSVLMPPHLLWILASAARDIFMSYILERSQAAAWAAFSALFRAGCSYPGKKTYPDLKEKKLQIRVIFREMPSVVAVPVLEVTKARVDRA